MPELEVLVSRIRSLSSTEIQVVHYCMNRAEERGIDLEEACKNIVSRSEISWRLSPRTGKDGIRLEGFLRVSPRVLHEYVVEVGDGVYLVNVIKINSRKQRRLVGYDRIDANL